MALLSELVFIDSKDRASYLANLHSQEALRDALVFEKGASMVWDSVKNLMTVRTSVGIDTEEYAVGLLATQRAIDFAFGNKDH